ncbi:hypothetical protein [Micromonospora sp. NPDC005197]|uniref:hypothetical protein n=1 Tax=unclassified Micromonospora TaxID=2617518 RepID=UPI0033AFEC14
MTGAEALALRRALVERDPGGHPRGDRDRFGSWPETGSGISRESFGNPSGWSS